MKTKIFSDVWDYILVILLFGLVLLGSPELFAMEQQTAVTAVTEVSNLKLRTWDVYALLWLLFVYRANNSLKRQQWYPDFMCKWKTSKDGRHRYKKIRVWYFRVCAVILFTSGVYFCWHNLIGVRFDDLTQVLIASVVIGLSAQKIIEIAMAQIEKRSPETHAILVDGLYKGGDDMTVFDKTIMVAVTGRDTREDKTRIMTQDEHADITGSNK